MEPSRDDQLRLLLGWITEQATGRLFVGPEVRAIDNSTICSTQHHLQRTRQGKTRYTTWKNNDCWRQERVIALWPNDKALQQLDDDSTIEVLGVLTWRLNEVVPWLQASALSTF